MAANSYQYRSRPTSMGGGGGSYVGYTVPTSLASNENGTYVCNSATATQVSFTGTSGQGYRTVTGVYGADGKLVGTFAFTSQFQ